MSPRVAVRLADVADRAGVTVSTASRALWRPDLVRDSTRARVEAAVQELGYVPNRIAQAVATGRTRTLVFVIPDLTNNLFARLARAVQAAARAKGYDIVIADSQMNLEREAGLIERARRYAEGIILCMPQGSYRAESGRPPMVAINRRMRGSHAVLIDQAHIVETQVDHLVGLGHERIAYVDGPKRYWATHERRRNMERLARTHDIQILGGVHYGFEGGVSVVDGLGPDVTAVITYADLQAAGVVVRAIETGRRVPQDLSVIGSNDMPIARITSPPITTMRTPVEAIGRAAVSLLLDTEATAGIAINETLTSELVVRQSTGPAPRARRRGRSR